ncbi:hypothetical protein [Dielma fastidiosa]|uniref:Phage portal protein n=1 Tax=Dielma fastidiosa TaxID=1034346 RepID=A0AB35UNP0_9FIRM|nr:hypothetical protein [Dielma fastidiosa]MDY5168601.1 hypothetical protein [Dielma fastidiosa]
MISEIQQYLKNLLLSIGYSEARIYLRKEDLLNSQDSRQAGCWPYEEELERISKRVTYTKDGQKVKRKQVFKRVIKFNIVLGEYKLAEAEALYIQFLSLIDEYINIDENAVPIRLAKAEWIDKSDEILKAKFAMHLILEFDTGIYKESGYAALNDLNIEVRKEENGN